ncbi:MAG: Ig-like domain-containing protein [bacterium]
MCCFRRWLRYSASLGFLLYLVSCSGDINVTTAPEVVWTDPSNGAQNVSLSTPIRVGFSRVMDPATISVTTFTLDNNAYGVVEQLGTTATFTPIKRFKLNTTYTVTITTGVRDRDGNPLEVAHVWHFHTVPPAPAVSRFNPDSGRAGCIITIYGANFSDNPVGNSVRFNGVQATIISASPTEIRAEVPLGAATGPITVATAGGRTVSGIFYVIRPGEIWEAVSSGVISSLAGVTWTGSRFIAVGVAGTILTSPDGVTWTKQVSGTLHGLNDVSRSGDRVVAVGDVGEVLSSPDGIEWERSESPTRSSLFAVTWTGKVFLAVGADGAILASEQGREWVSLYSQTYDWLYDVAVRGDLLAVCGHSGVIRTSRDGILWVPRESGTRATLLGVTVTETVLAVVGHNGTILTSTDGQVWVARQSQTSSHLGGLAWSGEMFATVGLGGIVLTSPEGINWTARISPTTADLTDLAWSGTRFVAVGYHGAIITSY